MASTLARRCSGDRCSQQGSGERVTVSVVANWPGLMVLPRFRAEYSLVRLNQRPSSGSPSRRLRTQWTPGQSGDRCQPTLPAPTEALGAPWVHMEDGEPTER